MRHEGSLTGLEAQNARLREKLELLQEAVETVRHGLCMFDDQGRIAYCNRRYPEVIGLPADKVRPGLPLRELLSMSQQAGHYPADRPLDDIEAEFWDKLSSNDPTPRKLVRGGRTLLIRPDRTADGKYVATFEDITAQQAAETALQQSEARLSTMLGAMPDCVKIFDEQGAIAYINPKGLELLEAPDLETLNASGHLPISGEYLDQAIQVHARVLSGETVIWTYEIVGMKGGRRDCEARAVPFHLPDGSKAHLSITREVTERKKAEDALRRSEERLRLVQEATGLADFEYDANGLTSGSERYFEQLGLSAGDSALVNKGCIDFVHPDDRERIVGEIVEANEQLREWSNSEFRIIRADNGATRWIACSTKMERDGSGALVRMIGGHLDITERKESETALQLSEERLRLVQEATGLADFEAGADGVAQLSDRFVEQSGLPPGTRELSHEQWMQVVHPDDRQRLLRDIVRSLDQDEGFQCEFRIVRPDNGEVRWISSRTKVERDASGLAARSIGAHLDITERKLSEEALRESEERFRLAAEAAGLGVWDYDAVLDKRDWSERFREIVGLPADSEPDLALAEACIHPADRAHVMRQVHAVHRGEQNRFEASFRIRRASDRAERWLTMNVWRTHKADNELRRIIMTVRDVTDEKTAEERVRWSASHDPLTRLANRALFQEKLDLAIRAAREDGTMVGVLLLDLDHFKQINDSLGHDVGDALLKMIADRLRDCLRKADTVARLGGDEFAIVVPRLGGQGDLMALSQAIQERMRAPFIHSGRMLDCRVSSGAAMFPEHGQSPREVLKNADLALYAAKSAGRATLTIYEPAMREDMQRQVTMVRLAREAIADDRIIPYYQPKLDLVSGTVQGFEALLRWRTPARRIGQPAMLAAAFEDLEVAAAISDRMIERAIADMRGWLDRGIAFQHVAVNASAAEFRRDNFAERILESLRRNAIPTRCFQIEVTETVFLGRGAEYVHRALALLNTQGVKIALDDFGTGYASLRHLKQFPVDIIKIDQSFVRDMEVDPGDEAIVRAVINLGRSLGIHVVAEGIESTAQAERLLGLDCDYGQGFLFSKAVPAKRVPALVAHWQSAGAKTWHRADGSALRLVASRT